MSLLLRRCFRYFAAPLFSFYNICLRYTLHIYILHWCCWLCAKITSFLRLFRFSHFHMIFWCFIIADWCLFYYALHGEREDPKRECSDGGRCSAEEEEEERLCRFLHYFSFHFLLFDVVWLFIVYLIMLDAADIFAIIFIFFIWCWLFSFYFWLLSLFLLLHWYLMICALRCWCLFRAITFHAFRCAAQRAPPLLFILMLIADADIICFLSIRHIFIDIAIDYWYYFRYFLLMTHYFLCCYYWLLIITGDMRVDISFYARFRFVIFHITLIVTFHFSRFRCYFRFFMLISFLNIWWLSFLFVDWFLFFIFFRFWYMFWYISSFISFLSFILPLIFCCHFLMITDISSFHFLRFIYAAFFIFHFQMIFLFQDYAIAIFRHWLFAFRHFAAIDFSFDYDAFFLLQISFFFFFFSLMMLFIIDDFSIFSFFFFFNFFRWYCCFFHFIFFFFSFFFFFFFFFHADIFFIFISSLMPDDFHYRE